MNRMHPTADQIVDYLHRELAPAEDAAITAHLRSCRDCTQVRDAEASLTELLRAHAKASERAMPASIATNVRQAVRTPPPASFLERLAAGLRPPIAVPAAAAVAVLLVAGVGAWQSTFRSTPIDAAYYVDSHAELSRVAPFADDVPVTPVLANHEAH